MERNLVRIPKIESTFLSCDKDMETILRKLFIESKPHSDNLKKLLVINNKDCLDADSELYKKIVKEMTLPKLIEHGYVKLTPRLKFPENEEIKSYILLSFDNFVTNASNPEFRDHTVTFDIICNLDEWYLGDYRLRPLKIAGIIDGILNNARLSGIGTFQFLGCNELIFDEHLAGYTLMYQAINGSDDYIPN